ncbi:TcpQ domain-containing protein [Burkholderia sp. R-70006]|nr:TcpQ domain-containing protein [Burkholderia sp. R-70006]
MPLTARAGFDIDPSLQRALTPAPVNRLVLASATDSAPATVAPAAGAASTTPPTVGAAAPAAPVTVTSLGGPSVAWNETVNGFANNEPAGQALSHLIPAGGRLIVNSPISAANRVSWRGNESRLTIARKILVDAKLDGRFDGDNLVIGNATAAPATAAGASMVPSGPANPGLVPRLWTMARGVMLSDGLADWMEQTGAGGDRYRWTLDWDAFDGPDRGHRVDYKIVAPLHFNGTVDQAAVQLILLYKRSVKPLHIDVNTEQRVIHITLKGQN